MTDLAEGKYLNYGFKAERKTINIDELQDIRKVITSIIEDAQQNHGLVIDDATKNNWIEWVVGYATDENLKRYSVQADRNDTVNAFIWSSLLPQALVKASLVNASTLAV